MNQTAKTQGAKLDTPDLANAGPAQTDEPVASSAATNVPAEKVLVSQGTGAARQAALPNPALEESAPLFSSTEAENLRSRWETIQIRFVDEPKDSLSQADKLVAESIKHLAEGFADERQKLERQWDRGEGVSTEDLRLLLRRYRTFFERLLCV